VIVADTNVVSELMRPEPAAAVVDWASGIDARHLAITAITVAEIEYGLARLPAGRRQRDLTEAWREVLTAHADRLLAYDADAARATTEILAALDKAGHPVSLADAQIAGLCRSRGHSLATRNPRDFAGLGLDLINPFESG